MNRHRGLTLPELMVSAAIVAGISGVLIATMKMGHRSWQLEQARGWVSSELRRGLNAMSREVAETRESLLDLPVGSNWAQSLTFQIPEDLDGDGTVLDGNGNLEWSDPIVYSLGGLNGQQLIRTQDGATRVLANGVNALQFRRQVATPNVVEIRLSVRRGAGFGDYPQEAEMGTSVRLRN